MNRAFDLDTIAPDDVVTQSAPKSEPATIDHPHKTKKIKKKKVVSVSEHVCDGPKKIDDLLNSVRGDSYSFLVKPKGFNFEDCEDCEEVLLVLRPHWFTNVKWVLIALALFFAPGILGLVFADTSSIFGVDIFPGTYKFIATLFWYLFVFIFIFENFLSWYFDVYIVTDRRVIDIHFNNLLDKKTSEANIEVIQDVTSRVAGISQTIFNYGDIKIQTAGAVDEIYFHKVPNPGRVSEVIQELREEIKKSQEGGKH